MLEDKTQVLPVPTMPGRLTVQVGRSIRLVGWSSLLVAPLPPTHHASPSSLWDTSARTDREVPFQTLIFLPFPTIYQGQKRDGQSSSHGSVFYPSQNGVRSSPFSGPIKARWCGRTRFIQENGEKHVDLILLEYSLHHSCYSHDPRATKLIGYVFKCLIKGPGI